MTSSTAWAHLPNAPHIDRVLADLKDRPEHWDAAWGAILALTVYDDCAYVLNLTPGAVRVMVSAGNEKAFLLYPAVIAMNQTKVNS